MTETLQHSCGTVVIGRNEGERLRRCLQSVLGDSARVVYVDSGSTDGSPEMAVAMGADLVQLDLSIPFTAARARNAGFRRLLALDSALAYVQFVDGDCEVVEGWQQSALGFLNENPEVAVVCGRRRERYPDRSVYNRLCDIEWNTPVGEALYCGGDTVMRVGALKSVDGFREDLIAGEEPELCVRLRANNWKVWRLDREMTLHDAAMLRFGQWWKRTSRAGYAFANGRFLHGRPPVNHWVREVRSIWIWGLFIPLTALVAAVFTGGWGALLLLLYPLQVLRLSLSGWHNPGVNFQRAIFLVLGKFPEMLGQLGFHRDRLLHRKATLIEYKGPE